MLSWTLLPDWKVLLWIVLLWDHLCAFGLKPTRWPLYSQKPTVFAWNVPTEDCSPRHDGTAINGGLPQVASLAEHLDKLPEGVLNYIRDPGAKGLSVIDWEEWRPLWIRNWAAKDVYRRHSRELVRQKHPKWVLKEVERVAQQEFEMSARKFMLETLRHAKNLRPNQLWGFYLFPDCYNHNYVKDPDMYTGRCPDVEMVRNDQLKWLWTESTALYPSVYLTAKLRSSEIGRQFVRNRVKESMRLASTGDGLARPVFVYTRPTYSNSLEQLTETDLVFTIGECVALGAAGIIMWGDAAYSNSRKSCSDMDSYLRDVVSRYLLNVSTAAELCSQTLCGFHGRCLRQNPESNAYLHLNPVSHTISIQGRNQKVVGKLGEEEKRLFQTQFQCQCYSGYQGQGCDQADPRHQKGAASRITVSLLQCQILMIISLLLC
ncbi:hyaluronidase-2 isoform X2 [Clinocottus analis]|uniref:hyaluronidase-2 isoform X2 n=1 Tax=Clinocottus analis TaxID=304258 RepID=UPI0035BFF9F3